jgi:hypothetical protein
MDSQSQHPARRTDRESHAGRTSAFSTNYKPYSDGSGGGNSMDGSMPKSPEAPPSRSPIGLGKLINKGLDALGAPDSGPDGGRVARKASRRDKKTHKENMQIHQTNMDNYGATDPFA